MCFSFPSGVVGIVGQPRYIPHRHPPEIRNRPFKKKQVHDAFDELGEIVQESALDGEGDDGFDDFFDVDGGDEEFEDDITGTHLHDAEEVVEEMLKQGRRKGKEEL